MASVGLISSGIIASDFNRRITLTSYNYSQSGSGGVSAVEAEIFDTWAKVEQKGGGVNSNQAQMMSDASYRITIRYRPQVTKNWNISYEGQTFIINSISFDNPAYKRFMIIDCSVSIKQTSWS